MALHPQIARALAAQPALAGGPLDPAALRAAAAALVPPPDQRVPLHSVHDAVVPAGAAGVPVRIYAAAAAPRCGIIVYLHGGAFFLGSLDTHDHVARALARETGCKVIAVGYRLAPEHAFPAGLEDAYAVLRWVIGSGGRLGWDHATLAVAGDSAGGTLAAVVAALARDDGIDALTHQVLYYPPVDFDGGPDRYPSLRTNATGYGLETAALEPFNAFYLRSGADPADPRVSPIKRADLSGLPPALVITAEYDPLRDEAERYAQRLAAAGVATTLTRYAGAGHGFVEHFSWLPEYYQAFTETRDFLHGRSDPGRLALPSGR